MTLNGAPIANKALNGYVTIDRMWKDGDTVTLHLPMPVRRVVANDKVEADRGHVALVRGPVVYCVEWPDVPGGKVLDLSLSDATPLTTVFRPKLLGGVQVITGAARHLRKVPEAVRQPDGKTVIKQIAVAEEVPFTAIPYYAWANRGPGQMTVWLKRSP